MASAPKSTNPFLSSTRTTSTSKPPLATTNPFSEEKDVELYTLDVVAVRAFDLIIGDIIPQSSDPYCKIIIGNKEYQSETIMKDLNPVWNCRVHHQSRKNPGKIRFEVWDWDKLMPDDSLGYVEVDVRSFFDSYNSGQDVVQTLSLLGVMSGRIQVSINAKRVVLSTLKEEWEQETKKLNDYQNDMRAEIQRASNLADKHNDLKEERKMLLGRRAVIDTEREELRRRLAELDEEYDQVPEKLETAEKNLLQTSTLLHGAHESVNRCRVRVEEQEEVTHNAKDHLDTLQRRLGSLAVVSSLGLE